MDLQDNKIRFQELIAHVRQQEDGSWAKPHILSEHLQGVATLAMHFAQKFGNGDWTFAAGILHDLGKSTVEFQQYIRTQSGFEVTRALQTAPKRKVVHSTHGAAWAIENLPPGIGKILAYLIAGHHGGLPDWHNEIGGDGNLSDRLKESAIKALPKANDAFVQTTTKNVETPYSMPGGQQLADKHLHLWIRMLYSCLVDSDFLDTERYMNPTQHEQRRKYANLTDLKVQIDRHMKSFGSPTTSVNKVRALILEQCKKHAADKSGLFTLTVPTGGGKTLASMVFALAHAVKYKKERVIVVIPYTSIIEQTARVYKNIFGEHNVLEHHSALDPVKETPQSRLASENWDAPIIVTTSVQFFESLFAAKSSACRKIHNIVNSVVIIDEVQMLPGDYLKPILETIDALTTYFNVTMVMCSATQPSIIGKIGTGQTEFIGLDPEKCHELMVDPNPEQLTQDLQRVEIKELGKFDDWSTLASTLVKYDSVLCVVNTRKDCKTLFELMPPGTIHLSANMCGEHRSIVIDDIRATLLKNKPVRVISTQLVEAGVDFDFPVVFRALAGFDSIAQAAGRCNREGKRAIGEVFVFEPPTLAPVGCLRKGAQSGREILNVDPEGCKNLRPSTFNRYFQMFFSDLRTFDKKNIEDLLVKNANPQCEFQFRTAAKRFQMIDDQNQISVLVKYCGKTDSRTLFSELEHNGPNRSIMRRLQRFSITLPEPVFNAVSDSFRNIHGIWCQDTDTVYNDTIGFVGNDGEIPIC